MRLERVTAALAPAEVVGDASVDVRDLAYDTRTVTEGTGTYAQIPGYTVAGKTGTAQKPDGHGGYGGGYVSSFVGFVPADDPKLVVLVAVDNPHGVIWGGVVAAPAFADIAKFDLQYLAIPPDAPETSATSSATG